MVQGVGTVSVLNFPWRLGGDAPPAAGGMKVEPVGNGYRIEEKLAPKIEVQGLDKMVADGAIRSYEKHDNTLVVWADSAEAAKKIAALPHENQASAAGSLMDRARELLVPPNMDETCAPEYLRFRGWSLAGTVLAGAINFMGARVNLDAVKVAFDSSANAALAGFVNGLVYKGTAMGASFMAQKGDADPKKCFLIGSLVNSANAVAVVGLLSILPKAYWPVYAAVSLTSAVANSLGGAAGVNIFNHIARGTNKGLVSSKNGNQDMLADTLGAPLAMGVSYLAGALGVNPYVLTVAALGPLLAFCNLQAARTLQFESMSRKEMMDVASKVIDEGKVPRSPRAGVIDTFKSLFRKDDNTDSGRLHWVGTVDEVVKAASPTNPETLFGIFREEKYLLAVDDHDQVKVAVRRDANMDDVFKAALHAQFLERTLNSKIPGMMRDQLGLTDRTLLVEMAMRALPKDIADSETLSQQGWNPNPASLDLERLNGNWAGPEVVRVDWITTEAYKKLLATPDVDALKRLMKPAAWQPPAPAPAAPPAPTPNHSNPAPTASTAPTPTPAPPPGSGAGLPAPVTPAVVSGTGATRMVTLRSWFGGARLAIPVAAG